jgi:hypothetical protein
MQILVLWVLTDCKLHRLTPTLRINMLLPRSSLKEMESKLQFTRLTLPYGSHTVVGRKECGQ